MRAQSNTRSSLFLIELIIAILFFSLGAAVCVQAFSKAHTVTAQAQDLSFASSTVSSAASVVKYTGGTLDEVRTYFPDAFADGEDIAVCYGTDFAICGPDAAAYTLRIHIDGAEQDLCAASIRMDGADGQTLYGLQLRYPPFPGEASHG